MGDFVSFAEEACACVCARVCVGTIVCGAKWANCCLLSTAFMLHIHTHTPTYLFATHSLALALYLLLSFFALLKHFFISTLQLANSQMCLISQLLQPHHCSTDYLFIFPRLTHTCTHSLRVFHFTAGLSSPKIAYLLELQLIFIHLVWLWGR